MTLQQFRLVVDQPVDQDTATALAQRCDDVTIERLPPRPGALITFDREAPSLVDAILSAVRDLDAVGLPAARVRDDDDLVTLAIIAERVGRSREAVRLWSVGRTGPGGFPSPVDALSVAYYRWSQVAPWLRDRMGMPVPDPEPVLAAVNLALQLRAMAPRLSRMDAVRALIAA
ncbi:MAG: hypothetical protein QOI74_497 [Micromonosporaceae bacterium]|nr:hypothetical protein [Micromonosporaceae bacterium]MDT5036206.1 hypothetical protein [Micromonosporaceae bacterium]